MPLLTYENIIPQRGEIVKRLTAVFKKYFGDFFCLGGGAFLRFAVYTSTEYIKSVTNYSCIIYILFIYFSYIIIYILL